MLHIAHIINPVKVNEDSDLFVAQPVTFESMKRAKEFAGGLVAVDLFTAQYPEDRFLIPPWFTVTPDLDRSVLDCLDFRSRRKLPLIKDIIDRVNTHTNAEYLIYSNVDIALMPHFYTTIKKLIEQGNDALLINRRTISAGYSHIDDLPLMYSDAGERHEGIDCFVFRKEWYRMFCLENAFVGASPIGACIVANMIAFCKKFVWVEAGHLTFHIGDDKSWLNKEFIEFIIYNFEQFSKILNLLLNKADATGMDDVKRAVLGRMITFCGYRLRDLSGKEGNETSKFARNSAEDLRECLRLYSQQKFDEILRQDMQQDNVTPASAVEKGFLRSVKRLKSRFSFRSSM